MSSNIFIMIMISSNFIFNFTNFCVIVSFLTKLLTLDILFSVAVRAVVIAKFVILGTSPLTSFILELRELTFLTTSSFTIVVYLNQQQQVLFYQHLIYLLSFTYIP